MATVNFRYDVEVSSGNFPIRYGTGEVPVTVASQTVFHDQSFTLATATTKTILNLGSATTDDLADADFIFLVLDQDTYVELVGSSAANNSTLQLKANIPLVIVDSLYSYNAAGSFAGSTQDLTTIRIRQASGSTANGRIIAST